MNIAKQILEDYWEKHKTDVLTATILIIGHLKDGGMRVEIVKETDLVTALEKYEKIVSQHVYSLQKTLPDIQLLAGSGKGDAKFGAIKCEKCVILSDEELFARRWGSATKYPLPVDDKPVEKKEVPKKSNGIGNFFKESAETKKPQEIENSVEKPEEKSAPKVIAPPKSKINDKKGATAKKPVQSQKKGYSNLFGKVSVANRKISPPTKAKIQDSPMDVDSESPNEKIPTNITTKSINPASNNSVNKKSSDDKISPKNKTNKSAKNNESPIETKTKEEKKSSTISTSSAKKSTKTEVKVNQKSRGIKRGRSKNTEAEAKKRKRIVFQPDSSEESAGSDDDCSIIEDTPPRETAPRREKSPTPPLVQHVNGKRKVRKLVDEMYEDEKGYLVTKKVHVYESCSEEEEPIKAPEPKPAATEISKIKKQTKQTTINNFFTRGKQQ